MIDAPDLVARFKQINVDSAAALATLLEYVEREVPRLEQALAVCTQERDTYAVDNDRLVEKVQAQEDQLATLNQEGLGDYADRTLKERVAHLEAALRELIAEWRKDAAELREATHGTWIEPSVREACADELSAVLASPPPETL